MMPHCDTNHNRSFMDVRLTENMYGRNIIRWPVGEPNVRIEAASKKVSDPTPFGIPIIHFLALNVIKVESGGFRFQSRWRRVINAVNARNDRQFPFNYIARSYVREK